MVHRSFLPALCCLGVGILVSPLPAAEPFNPYNNPNPFLATFYEQNREAIEQLETKIRSEEAPDEERVQALQDLNDAYPDVALPLVAELVKGDNEPLAARAAVLLGNASMMMNHEAAPDAGAHQDNPFVTYLMQKHDLIFDTLRTAVQDQRDSVRNEIASVLTSQSDEKGLELISAGLEKQQYTDEQYVYLLSLGSPEATGKYLERYLDSENPELQAAVGAYLAESSTYASLVVDKVLLNDAVPETVKTEVVRNISDLDALFPLIASPKTSATLYSDAIGTYVERKGDSLSAPSIQLLLDGVNQRTAVPGSKLDDLRIQLQDLYQERMQ